MKKESQMENVKLTREGNKLIIEIDLNAEGRPSRSGRGHVIASSVGNRQLQVDEQEFILNFNIWKRVSSQDEIRL